MRPPVVDVNPLLEACIEFAESDRLRGQHAQELLADGSVEPFNNPLALGSVRTCVNHLHTKRCTAISYSFVTKRAAIVVIQPEWQSSKSEGAPETVHVAGRSLGPVPCREAHKAASVVNAHEHLCGRPGSVA